MRAIASRQTTIDLHQLKELLNRSLDQCERERGRFVDLDADYYWLLEQADHQRE